MLPMRLLVDLRSNAQCTWRALLSSTLSRVSKFTLPLLIGFTGFIIGTLSPTSTKAEPTSCHSTLSSCIRPPYDTAASSTSADDRLLQQVFAMVDTDGDGYVSVDDLVRHLAKLRLVEDRDELKGLVQSAIGSVRSGDRLDYEGFVYLYEVVCEGVDEEGAMAEAFAVFDVDGDGFISVAELRQVLMGMGFTSCHDEAFCHRILTCVDSTLDGKIDLHEFRSFFQSLNYSM